MLPANLKLPDGSDRLRQLERENAHLLATIILYESCGFIADPVDRCVRHNGIVHKPRVDRGEPHVEDVTAADLVPFQVQPMEY